MTMAMVNSRYGVSVCFRHGPSFHLMCRSLEEANRVIDHWREAITNRESLISFKGLSGLKNLHRVDEIVSMFVIDDEVDREIMVDMMKKRKAMESEVELSSLDGDTPDIDDDDLPRE